MINKYKIPKRVFLYKYVGLSEMEISAANLIISRLQALGVRVDNWLPMVFLSDLAIFFGTAKFRPKISHLVKLLISRLHSNFIVFESPVVGRATQEIEHKDPLFRVGISGFFADYGFDYALSHQFDPTAKILLMGKSHFIPEVQFNTKGVIGIALQIPGDASIQGVDQIAEVKQIITEIRASNFFNDSKIIIRTPPLLATRKDPRLNALEAIDGVEIQLGTNHNKEFFFQVIEFLVTFSSTMGVDALVRGIPACGLDERSFLRLVSASTLGDLLGRNIELNPNYLNILANTTWRIEDIFSHEFIRVVMGNMNVETS